MFDIVVQPETATMISNIKEFFLLVSNVIITGITFYTAWLRFFSRKIAIIYTMMPLTRHWGDVISCTLENQTLSNFTVKKIDVVLQDKYICEIKRFFEPLVMEPFKAYTITADGITDSSPIPINDLNTMFNTSKLYFILYTSKGEIKAHYKKSKPTKIKNFISITLFRNYFNGKVLAKDVKYAISILCESGKYKDILIDSSGFMSDDLYGLNYLSEETIKDFHTCYEYFKKIGLERGLTFFFYNLAFDEDRLYIKFTPPSTYTPAKFDS